MKRTTLAMLLVLAMVMSMLPVTALAVDEPISLAEFVEAVEAADYKYDGNGVVVEIAPASGCKSSGIGVHTGHPAFVDDKTPDRLQDYNVTGGKSYYAQYQRFSGDMDVSISNVTFKMVAPEADIYVCDAWSGTKQVTATPNNLDAELQLLNTGSVSFSGCTFENVAVSPISASSVSFDKCNFSGLAAYGIKDVQAPVVSVTGCGFDSCDGGVYMSGGSKENPTTYTSVAYTGNSFTNMGERGAVQFSATGDYGTAAISIEDNSFSAASGSDGGFLRLLNYTLPQTVLAQLEENNEITGGLYTTDSIDSTAQLPAGTSFPTGMTVYDGTNYYATMDAALKGIHQKGINTLWCKPGADVGEMTHSHVCADLTVYGNGAYVSGGSGQDFELDTYDDEVGHAKGEFLTQDVTLKVYNLNSCAVWSQRNSTYTLNIYMENCQNMNRVYLSGTSGTNNITLVNCSFDGTATGYNKANSCTVYSNAPGTIRLEDCTFTGVQEPINLNNKSAADTKQTIEVVNCTFTDCSTADICTTDVTWAAPIRIVSSTGAASAVTVDNCTFSYPGGSASVNGDVLLGDGREGWTSYPVSATIVNTAAEVQFQNPGDRTATANNGRTETVAKSATAVTLSNVAAKIGDAEYITLQAAIDAAFANDVIELVADTNESVTIDKANLTINGNGHTVTAAGTNTAITVAANDVTLNNVNAQSQWGIALVVNQNCANPTVDGGTYTTCTEKGGYSEDYGKQGEGAMRFMGGNGKVTVKNATAIGGIHVLNPGSYEITGNTIDFDYTGQTALVGILLKTDAEVSASGLMDANTIAVPNANSFYVKIEPTDSWTSTDEIPANDSAAKIGDSYYKTLQAAVDAVADNGTITLIANCAEKVTVSRVVTFTIDPGTYSFTGSVSAGSGYTVSKTDNTYTVTERTGGGSTSSKSYKVTVKSSTGGDVTVTPTSASKGLTITVKIKTDEGYTFDELTVTDASGNELKLNKRSDTEYSFSMPDSAVTVKATFVNEDGEVESGLPFDDVDVGDWFYDAVVYAYENELMNGVADDEFAPNATLTRGMMATLLYRLEGEPDVTGVAFDDIGTDMWYTDAITWAAANEIVNGYGDGVFAPNDAITREQLAAILYRYAAYKDYGVDHSETTEHFTDAESISEYAIGPMNWAVGAGLMNGVTDTTLQPQGTATRAQVATMLMRFIENIAE